MAFWLLVPGKALHLIQDAMVRIKDSTPGELQLEKPYISFFSCDGELIQYAYEVAVILILTQDSVDHALVVIGMQLQTTMLLGEW